MSQDVFGDFRQATEDLADVEHPEERWQQSIDSLQSAQHRQLVGAGVHLDAIESVLERYGLALVVEFDGEARLVGDATDGERRAWDALKSMQRAAPQEVARSIGEDLVTASQWLHSLHERRLVMRFEDEYVALGGRA